MAPVKVKGKKAKIVLHQAMSVQSRPLSAVRRLTGIKARLIGRKAELNQLIDAAERLKQGRSGVVFLSGEAGTGKSRLVEDFKASLKLSEVQWRESFSYSHSQNIPYFPLIDLISRTWQIEESDSPEHVKRKVESNLQRLLGKQQDFAPYIGSLFGLKYPESETIDPEFWKSHLFEGIRALLVKLTQIAPTVLLLEDLHWSDPSSQELFRRILMESGYNALFICTYRPPFSLLTAYQMEGLTSACTEIKLRDLSVSEAEDMVASLLKADDIPHELRRFVKEKVEGNPFYLEEVVNSLIESEALLQRQGSWIMAGSVHDFDIPLTINGVISSRIDRLETDVKRVLQESSVIGRTFLYDVLKKITRVDAAALNDCLNSLEMLDLVRRSSVQPNLEFVFKHSLTQEVVYNGLLKKERQDIHERIGHVIEDLFHDRLSEFFETLAFHFKQGKSLHKAVDYLMKSGEKSLMRYAVEESHLYFKEAFDLLINETERTREDNALLVRLLLEWAGVYWYRGRFGDLEELLDKHRELVEALDDKGALGMFYALRGMSAWSREKLTDADDYLKKALDIGLEIGDKKIVGYSYTFLSYNCADWGLLDEAISYAEEAQRAGDPDKDHPEALAVTGYAHWTRGERKKLSEAGGKLLEFGNNHSNIRHMVEGYWIQGCGHLTDGNFPAAISSCKQALQLSVDPFYSQFPKLSLAYAYLSHEQFEKAEKLLSEIVTFSKKYGAETVGTSAEVLLGIVLINKGRVDEGMRMVQEGQKSWLKNQGRWRYALSEYLLGNIYLRIVEGKSLAPFAGKKAENHYNRAVECAEKIGAKGLTGQAYLNLGHLYSMKGKKDLARDSLSRSIRCFDECGIDTYMKRARMALEILE